MLGSGIFIDSQPGLNCNSFAGHAGSKIITTAKTRNSPNEALKVYYSYPTSQKINLDITTYVTDQALRGFFILMEEEENKVRSDPSKRPTELQKKKIFGYADRYGKK